MPAPELPTVDPPSRAASDLIVPDTYDLTFGGFGEEAFEILERLREHPRIEQYRGEKAGIKAFLQEPFKRFRDDLVVNFVLPNRLAFETERNVFSRLLKNDFGAGGCHHHLWMAIYRPGYKRLTDLQLSQSIYPDRFTSGLYVGDYATKPLRTALGRIDDDPDGFLDLVNPLLERPDWQFSYAYGAGAHKTKPSYAAPLRRVPDDVEKARGIWVRRSFARADVLAWRGELVRHVVETMTRLWPIYRFWAGERR